MAIAALERGLAILDYMIASLAPRRYKQIKRNTGDLTDASLNRLLKSLIDSGYLEKDDKGKYRITAKVHAWKGFLTDNANLRSTVEPLIKQLTQEINESAAFAAFINDRIVIVYSINVAESVTIIAPGGHLPFQTDHAASLAVMELMKDADRARAIQSENSQIDNTQEYADTLAQMRFGNCLLDHSRLRPGISRMAIGVTTPNLNAAIFVATTTTRMQEQKDTFAKALSRYKMEMAERLG